MNPTLLPIFARRSVRTYTDRPDSLACYGSAWARTPHTDRIEGWWNDMKRPREVFGSETV